MNIYIITQGARVGIDEGNIYIQDAEKRELAKYPQKLVENIFVFGNVYLTTQAISFFLKNKLRVLFLSSKGDYIGSLISIDQDKVFFKYKQWEKFKDEKIRIKLSRLIIYEKFRNQKGLIYGFSKNQNKQNIYLDFISKSNPLIENLPQTTTLDHLRGIEGIVSSYYFNALKNLIINKEFNFEKRIHYPPKDEVNSLLSFGYTLLVNFITGFIIAYSLDPYVGFYHDNKYKRENFSLDLIEEFRPLIDQMVLKLVNLKMITNIDFEKSEEKVLIKNNALNKIFYLFQKDIVRKSKIINKIEERLKFITKILKSDN
jgi:CRISPR-associated protein Cas1